jgi:hypothetical protein
LLHEWVKAVRQEHIPPVVQVVDGNVFGNFWERNDKDYFLIIDRNGKMIA